jgi:hypothetical protein
VPLYVVMTNLPGAAARALLNERLTNGAEGPIEELLQAVDGACEFVELENEHGAGVGPDSGVTWHTESSFLSDKTVVKLGPFAPCDENAVRRGAERIDDLLAQLGVNPEDRGDVPNGESVKVILARAVLNGAAAVTS